MMFNARPNTKITSVRAEEREEEEMGKKIEEDHKMEEEGGKKEGREEDERKGRRRKCWRTGPWRRIRGGGQLVPVCVLRYLPLPIPREEEAGKKGRMKENTKKNKERED